MDHPFSGCQGVLPQQIWTGKLTERRVLEQLRLLGLEAHKPIPDVGIDIEAFSPQRPENRVSVQVKGRNPQKDPNLRWFQVRVLPGELEIAEAQGLSADSTWQHKVRKVDFFVLDAVKVNEFWVLPQDRVFELISLNEHRYRTRPDNVFSYARPLKQKQKEMNLDIEIDGVRLTVNRPGIAGDSKS